MSILPSSNYPDPELDVLFPGERKRFVSEQLVTAPSSLMGEATTSVSKRREGGAKYVPKLGGAEEKAVSEAKLEGRASSGTNPNQDTTGPCQAMGTWLLTRVLEKVS